jgi:5'-nucleotidase
MDAAAITIETRQEYLMSFQQVVVGCVLAVALAACHTSSPPLPNTVDLKIIAFNDFHGNLLAPGKLAADPTAPVVPAGGIEYLAAYAAQIASLSANHIVVSAGDLTGASPLMSAAYHDEGTIQAMNALGLELTSVGNHEFDGGLAELQRKQAGGCLPGEANTCLEKGEFHGADFKYLAANVFDAVTGKLILPPYAVKTFQGIPVAFIGVVLKGTPNIVLPRGVQGLTFRDEADSVNALIPELRAEGVDAIVVLIHQGGEQLASKPPGAVSINGCAGQLGDAARSPILDVVSRLDDAVDLVISGHTHRAYNCRLPNSIGRRVPVTEAGAFGQVLTRFDVTLSGKTHRMTEIVASNVLISQPEADAAGSPVHGFLSDPRIQVVRRIVADYQAAVAPIGNRVIGSIARPLPSTRAASGEQLAGDLAADSQLAATAAASDGAAVVSLLGSGGVRYPGFDLTNATYPHEVTYGEALAVRPFGNRLITVTLTAQGIKDLLEQQFAGCHGQTTDSILQVSNGFHMEWSAAAAPCSKIVNASIMIPANDGAADRIVVNGVVQHPAKAYRVSADEFLAAGKDNFSAMLEATNPVEGTTDIAGLAAYMTSTYLAPKPPFDPNNPALHLPRIVRLP